MNEYEDKNLGYFTFYPADFLSSTMHLSNEQVGAYMRILCFLWKKKRARETELKAVGYGSVIPNETQWLSIIELLVNDGEFFWSKRMEFEREKAMKGYIVKCENGKKGGRPKKNNLNETENKPIGYDSVNLNETDGVSNQNQNQIIINDKEDTHIPACEKLDFTDREVVRTESTQIPTKETAKAWADYHFQKLDFDVWFKHWDSLGWRDSNGRPVKWQQKMAYNAKERMFIKTTATTQKQQIKQVGYDPDQGRETLMNWYDKMKLQEV